MDRNRHPVDRGQGRKRRLLIAQTCAPLVAAETLAGVVSLKSRFVPYNIRLNSGAPLARQPKSKAEVIEAATTLAAERHDIQIGLGGLGIEELRRLKLCISDAFDPCLNLQGTAALLDGYYRLAIQAGAALIRSGDYEAITAEIAAIDMTWLKFRDADDTCMGSVVLVHGNDKDVIHDCSDVPAMFELCG